MKTNHSRIVITSCVAIVCSTLAFGQIFISPDDFPNVTGMTLTYYANVTNSVPVNVGNSGPAQTWDFTEGPEEQEVQEHIIRAEESPFYEQFPEANRVRVSDINQYGIPGTVYTHRRMSNDQLTLLGLGADIGGYPIPIRLGDTGLQEYPLPLYYEDEWDNTVQFDTVFTIANPDTTIPLDSIDVRLVVSLGDQAQADAWGTLQGPLGENQVLRVRHDTGVEATAYVWVVIFWVPVWDTSFVQIRYEWLANDYGPIVNVASQPGETNPNFNNAIRVQRLIDLSTGVPPAHDVPIPTTISLLPNYPNPFNESTALTFSLPAATNGRAALAIYNVLGQRIITLWEGTSDGSVHHVIWNGQNAQSMPVASGMYFVTLRTGSNIRTLPIIKLD
jgi:hypothetical protein